MNQQTNDRIRPGYRPDFWPTDQHGGPTGVAEMCSLLHGITNGSCYPYYPDDVDLMVRCLEWLRDNWEHPSSAWESALLALVICTLDERKPAPEVIPYSVIEATRHDDKANPRVEVEIDSIRPLEERDHR